MTRAGCPSCGAPGRAVGEITLRSLMREEARAELGVLGGFSFCASPQCELAYFAADGRTASRNDVRVRIGVKETESPRPLCYCFDYTAEDIEAETRGAPSAIVEEITARCRDGLDRCAETNPRGACCLGDVRRAAKSTSTAMGDAEPGCCATPHEAPSSTSG